MDMKHTKKCTPLRNKISITLSATIFIILAHVCYMKFMNHYQIIQRIPEGAELAYIIRVENHGMIEEQVIMVSDSREYIKPHPKPSIFGYQLRATEHHITQKKISDPFEYELFEDASILSIDPDYEINTGITTATSHKIPLVTNHQPSRTVSPPSSKTANPLAPQDASFALADLAPPTGSERTLPSVEHDPTSSVNTVAKETTPLLHSAKDNNGILSAQEAKLRAKHTPPSIPISIPCSGVSGSVSTQSSSLNYKNKHMIAKANIGIGYATYQDEQNLTRQKLTGQYSMGVALNKNAAIGAHLLVLPQMQDLSLMGAYYLPESRLKLKTAVSYLWGKQDFLFPSESETRDLSQMGFFLSGEHILDEQQYPWLHSIGLSGWTSQTKQTSVQPKSNYYTIETSDSHDLYEDTKTLNLGQLIGSAVDVQAAPQDNIVMKLSLGYEQVKYPLLDGSTDINKSLYQALKIDYEPIDHLILGTEYKKGSSETRASVHASMHGWSMMLYQNWGLNGVKGHRGAMLSYNLTPWNNDPSIPLAKRMRPSSGHGALNLLNDAVTRPIQLPLTFMAKVDPESSKNVANVDKAGLPNDASVVIENGVITITVPDETSLNITGIAMNSPSGTEILTPSTYTTTADNQILIPIVTLHSAITTIGDHNFTITAEGDTSHTININTTAESTT